MKTLAKLVALLVIAAAAVLLLRGILLPSLGNLFKAKAVTIDETPILIKQIKSIGQLITYTSLNEVVADTTIPTRGARFVNTFNRLSPFPVLPPADKQLVLISRGKVLAGTDLTLLTDSSVRIKNDTVTLRLPPPQILDAIVNPAGFETFVERGEWSSDEVLKVKQQARRKMIESALQQNILPKAGERSRVIMKNFLENMGYKQAVIF